MLNALYIAAVGLQAQQGQLDASANNFANMATPAYKRQSVDFSGILGRASTHGQLDAVIAPEAITRRQLRNDMSAGTLQATGRPLDVAIGGSGFFEVELPDAKTGYTRGGSLQIGDTGELSTSGGLPLKTDVRVPTGAIGVGIDAAGHVTATLAGDSTPSLLGQLELVVLSNPESLQFRGDGVFTAADDAPAAARGRPGDTGIPALVPKSVEASNVDLTSEIVSLMLTQRVYELNSRVAQAADEMMGLANNLRRG
jgi:flagellar basal-body rod protein FlgG